MRYILFIAVVIPLTLMIVFGFSVEELQTPFVLVFDASQSMENTLSRDSRILLAKKNIKTFLKKYKAHPFAFVVFGNNVDYNYPSACSDVSILMPMAHHKDENIDRIVNGINVRGRTALASSLSKAIGLLSNYKVGKIIVITDGIDTCGGNPCEIAKSLKIESGTVSSDKQYISIDIMSLSLENKEVDSISCVPTLTLGKMNNFVDDHSFNLFMTSYDPFEALERWLTTLTPTTVTRYIPTTMPILTTTTMYTSPSVREIIKEPEVIEKTPLIEKLEVKTPEIKDSTTNNEGDPYHPFYHRGVYEQSLPRNFEIANLDGKLSEMLGPEKNYKYITSSLPSYTSTTTTIHIDKISCTNFNTLKMTKVPAGSFFMGSDIGNPDERPAHLVLLDSFLIDRYEVTNGEFCEFLNQNQDQLEFMYHDWINIRESRIFKTNKAYMVVPGWENHPVNFVSYYGAEAYAAWKGLALPTEAQWEYAAGYGYASERATSNNHLYAWGYDESKAKVYAVFDVQADQSGNNTRRVGSLKANELGLFDMSGNVWEWCRDWYQATYYYASQNINPIGPFSGSSKVLKGGSWYNPIAEMRVRNRNPESPEKTFITTGFRCALTCPRE